MPIKPSRDGLSCGLTNLEVNPSSLGEFTFKKRTIRHFTNERLIVPTYITKYGPLQLLFIWKFQNDIILIFPYFQDALRFQAI